jgi:hypothetical protein
MKKKVSVIAREPSVEDSKKGVEQFWVDTFYDQVLPMVLSGALDLHWSPARLRRWKSIPKSQWRERIPVTRPGEEVGEAKFPGGIVLRKGDALEVWFVNERYGRMGRYERLVVGMIRTDGPGVWDIYPVGKSVYPEVNRVARMPNGALAIGTCDISYDEDATKFLQLKNAKALLEPPRTPGAAEWKRFERKIGRPFPVGLKPLFNLRREHECWETPLFREFECLDATYAGAPIRLLHLAGEGGHCGDFLGLYFPWNGEDPFLVAHGLDEAITWPLTANISGFGRDPDAFPCWGKRLKGSPATVARRKRLREEGGRPWEDLLAKPGAASPERELLKDLCFQKEEFDEESEPFFGPFVKRFGTAGAVEAAVRKHLKSPRECVRTAKWDALSVDLEKLGEPRLAMVALQNGITLHMTSHAPEAGDWKSIAKLLVRMNRLAKRGGDALDRAMIPVHLAFANGAGE